MDQNFDKEEIDLRSPVLPPVDLRRERAIIGTPLLAVAFIFLFSGVAQLLLHTVASLYFPNLTRLEGYATVLSLLALYGVSMPLSLLIFRAVPACAPQRRSVSADALGDFPVFDFLRRPCFQSIGLLRTSRGILLRFRPEPAAKCVRALSPVSPSHVILLIRLQEE